MAKHHGGACWQIQFVRFVHNIKPFLRTTFAFANQPAHPVHQYFCTGTGQAVHTRGFQGFQHIGMRNRVTIFVFEAGNMRHFGRSQCMQPDIGEFGLYGTKCVYIKLQTQLGVMPALQQQLVATPSNGFFHFAPVGGHICDISPRVARNTVEVAEFAVGYTNIGGVYIAVYLPGYFSVLDSLFSQRIGGKHQVGQRGMSKQVHTLFNGQKRFIQRFFKQ